MKDPAEKWRGIDKRTLSDVDLARRHVDLYGGGTVTGRFSSQHPPFAELPKMQIPRERPKDLVEIDYRSVEERVLAWARGL